LTQFVEIAIQRISNRGIIVPVAEAIRYINANDEMYMSMYRYDEEVLKHFEIRKTIANYRGKHYLPHITFDIDKGEASDEDLLTYVRMFIEDLELDEEYIQPWYSGRGYHIVVPNLFGLEGSNDLPAIMKATIKEHFPDVDQLYDGARLMRVGYTINSKTGLYKTPFKVEEIKSLSAVEIQNISRKQRKDFRHIQFNAVIELLWADKVVQIQKQDRSTPYTLKGANVKIKSDSDIINGDAEKEMNGVVTCVQKMFVEGPQKGSRHTNMTRMISAYRRHGLPREAVHSIMQGWLAGQEEMKPYEVKIQVDQIYDKGYRFGCQDAILAKYCDSRCVYHTGKNLTLTAHNSDDLEKAFAEYANKDFSTTAVDLGEYYPTINGQWMMYPQELIVVTGITGLGKTAWVQNLAVMLNNMKILFFSLELHKNLAYRRFLQMAHGMAKHEVFEHYKTANPEPLGEALQHIEIITTTPELSAMERMIAEMKPQLVIVDTDDEIEISGMKSFDKDVAVGKGLKHIAEKHNIIMIAIHHTDKTALRNGKVNLASIKGTSTTVQKADKVLAINGQPKSLYRTLDALKVRDEKFINLQFELVRKSFWYKEVNRVQAEEG